MLRLPPLLLLLLLLLVGVGVAPANAAPSVYEIASPYVYLAPPFAQTSKLLLTDGTLTLDTDNGYFSLSLSELFSQQGGPTVALTITMRGNVTFAPPSLMLFGFPSSETAFCSQSPSSPPLCPGQQQYVNGPFNFGAYPASGPSSALILEEQPYVNPSTGQAMNFLFASQALTWACNGTCVDLHTLVPQSSVVNTTNSTTACRAVVGSYNASNLAAFDAGRCGWVISKNVFIGDGFDAVSLSSVASRRGALQLAANYGDWSPGLVSYTGSNMINNWYLPADTSSYTILPTLASVQNFYSDPVVRNRIGVLYGIAQTYNLYGNLDVTTMIGMRVVPTVQANFSGVITNYQTIAAAPSGIAGASATITNYEPFTATDFSNINVTNARAHRCSGGGVGQTINTCFSTTERTGATNNAAYHIDSDAATDGASYCAGTAFDVCMRRIAANTWGLKSGNSFTIPCQSVVGVWNPSTISSYTTTCGLQAASRRFTGDEAGMANFSPLDPRYGKDVLSSVVIDFPTVGTYYARQTSIYNYLSSDVNNNSYAMNVYGANMFIYSTPGIVNSYSGVNGESITVQLFGNQTLNAYQERVHSFRPQANFNGTITSYYGMRNNLVGAAGSALTITNYYGTLIQPPTLITVTNMRAHRCSTNSGLVTGVNSCFTTTERTGATNNAAYHIDSNSATCGAGLVAGSSFDVCLYRGRAGAWTGPTGTDLYTDGFVCAGAGCTSSAPTSTSTGVYDSGTRVASSISCTGATCSLTNGALSITVSSSGVTSLTGTANQIAFSASTGAVTASIPTNPVLPGYTTTDHYVTTAGTPTCTVLGPAGAGATCSVTGTDSGFVAALNTGTGVTSGATSLRIDYARAWPSRPYGISSSVASGTTVTELLTTSPCWTVGPGDVNGFWMFNSCLLADSKTYERTFTVMG